MIRKDWVSHEMFQDGTEDGTEVGTTLMAVRVITTHTLDRWRRKALKMAKTGYAIQWGDLAQDILRVLE